MSVDGSIGDTRFPGPALPCLAMPCHAKRNLSIICSSPALVDKLLSRSSHGALVRNDDRGANDDLIHKRIVYKDIASHAKRGHIHSCGKGKGKGKTSIHEGARQ